MKRTIVTILFVLAGYITGALIMPFVLEFVVKKAHRCMGGMDL